MRDDVRCVRLALVCMSLLLALAVQPTHAVTYTGQVVPIGLTVTDDPEFVADSTQFNGAVTITLPPGAATHTVRITGCTFAGSLRILDAKATEAAMVQLTDSVFAAGVELVDSWFNGTDSGVVLTRVSIAKRFALSSCRVLTAASLRIIESNISASSTTGPAVALYETYVTGIVSITASRLGTATRAGYGLYIQAPKFTTSFIGARGTECFYEGAAFGAGARLLFEDTALDGSFHAVFVESKLGDVVKNGACYTHFKQSLLLGTHIEVRGATTWYNGGLLTLGRGDTTLRMAPNATFRCPSSPFGGTNPAGLYLDGTPAQRPFIHVVKEAGARLATDTVRVSYASTTSAVAQLALGTWDVMLSDVRVVPRADLSDAEATAQLAFADMPVATMRLQLLGVAASSITVINSAFRNALVCSDISAQRLELRKIRVGGTATLLVRGVFRDGASVVLDDVAVVRSGIAFRDTTFHNRSTLSISNIDSTLTTGAALGFEGVSFTSGSTACISHCRLSGQQGITFRGAEQQYANQGAAYKCFFKSYITDATSSISLVDVNITTSRNAQARVPILVPAENTRPTTIVGMPPSTTCYSFDTQHLLRGSFTITDSDLTLGDPVLLRFTGPSARFALAGNVQSWGFELQGENTAASSLAIAVSDDVPRYSWLAVQQLRVRSGADALVASCYRRFHFQFVAFAEPLVFAHRTGVQFGAFEDISAPAVHFHHVEFMLNSAVTMRRFSDVKTFVLSHVIATGWLSLGGSLPPEATVLVEHSAFGGGLALPQLVLVNRSRFVVSNVTVLVTSQSGLKAAVHWDRSAVLDGSTFVMADTTLDGKWDGAMALSGSDTVYTGKKGYDCDYQASIAGRDSVFAVLRSSVLGRNKAIEMRPAEGDFEAVKGRDCFTHTVVNSIASGSTFALRDVQLTGVLKLRVTNNARVGVFNVSDVLGKARPVLTLETTPPGCTPQPSTDREACVVSYRDVAVKDFFADATPQAYVAEAGPKVEAHLARADAVLQAVLADTPRLPPGYGTVLPMAGRDDTHNACGAVNLVAAPPTMTTTRTVTVTVPAQERTATATLQPPPTTTFDATARTREAATNTSSGSSSTGGATTAPTPPVTGVGSTSAAPMAMPTVSKTVAQPQHRGARTTRTATIDAAAAAAPATPDRSGVVGGPDSDTRTAVTATATSVAVASIGVGLVGPATAAHASRIIALERLLACHYKPTEVAPSFLEFPLQFSLVLGTRPVLPRGIPATQAERDAVDAFDGYARLNGAVVAAALLVAVSAAVKHAAVWRLDGPSSVARRRLRHYAAVASAVFAAFFVPNTVGAAVLVLGHAATPVAQPVLHVACALVALAALSIDGACVAVMHRWCRVESAADASAQDATSETSSSAPRESVVDTTSAPFVDGFAPLFDGARAFAPLHVRGYYFEETLVSWLLAIAGGVRPTSGSCTAPVAAAVCVALAHLGYITAVRPYRTRLETVFAVLVAVVQVAATVGAAVSVAAGSVADADAAEELVGWALVFQAGLLFLQPVALAVWSVHRRCTRTRRPEAATASLDHSVMSQPLLVVPADGGATTTNPLALPSNAAQ